MSQKAVLRESIRRAIEHLDGGRHGEEAVDLDTLRGILTVPEHAPAPKPPIGRLTKRQKGLVISALLHSADETERWVHGRQAQYLDALTAERCASEEANRLQERIREAVALARQALTEDDEPRVWAEDVVRILTGVQQ